MSLSLRCSECGGANFTTAKKCYLCGKELTPPLPGALPPPLPQPTRGPWTYSLSTLFLIVTLAGVCFGLIAAAPGLGIPVAVLIAPAFIRTLVITAQRRAHGDKPTAEEKVGGFFASLAIVLAIVLAAGAAFFAACSVVCLTTVNSRRMSDGTMVALALGAGAIVALPVGIWILVRTWPKRRR